MQKYIITFGSGQLTDFNVDPNSVALVIEEISSNRAREVVFNYKGIGTKFCTSYSYEDVVDEFKNDYNMKEYTLEELEKLRKE